MGRWSSLRPPTACRTWIPCDGEARGRVDGRLVEPPRALRAAEHQQGRTIGVETECGARLRPPSRPVQVGDRAAQRHADVPRAGDRVGDGAADEVGEPGAYLVGQTGPRVGLVDDDRDATARGEVRRQRDVAAEPDDDVGASVLEHRAHLRDRRAHPRRQPDEVHARAPRHRGRGDEAQVVAALRDETGLEPALGAERGDADVGVVTAQAVGEVERGLDVPGRSSAREDDVHRGHRPRAVDGRLERRGRGARPASARAKDMSMPRATRVGTSEEPP